MSERGQFGDMFGVVNALFSGLAFAGIIITILQQKRELQQGRAEFVTQRFEHAFFNLIKLHNDNIDRLHFYATKQEYRGRMYLSEYYNSLRSRLDMRMTLDEAKKVYIENYENTYGDILSNYFVSLKSLLGLVQRESNFTDQDKSLYYSIVESQLTDQEKTIVYYHAVLGDDIPFLAMFVSASLSTNFTKRTFFNPDHNLLFKKAIEDHIARGDIVVDGPSNDDLNLKVGGNVAGHPETQRGSF